MSVKDNDYSELAIGQGLIERCTQFNYLGVTISATGTRNKDISKIGKGKRVIRQVSVD